MRAYAQLVQATAARDGVTIGRLIREFPELHEFVGEEGSALGLIGSRCPEHLELAFAAGLHPDARNTAHFITFLQQAVCDNDLGVVRLCLRFGADIERRNCDGETALGYAACHASLRMVQALIEAGAEVNATERYEDGSCRTALDVAQGLRRTKIISYLRAHGGKRHVELSPPA